MRRTPRRASKLATILPFSLVGLLSCNAAELQESTSFAQIGECDTEWVCGSNSPEIDHYGFHELHLEGDKNREQFQIVTKDGLAQIWKGGVGYTLKVLGSRIYGFDKKGFPVLSGLGLQGSEIRLLHNGETSYTIRIEAVRAIRYAVASQDDSLEAYALSWYDENGNPPNGKRLVCEPPTILPANVSGLGEAGDPTGSIDRRSVVRPHPDADELLGMNPGETVVFEGDRIDAATKTMGAEFNTTWINFGCAGHTLAKMHLTRHTKASNSAAYGISDDDRQATLKMMVADYCGDGTPFTIAGERVRWKGGLVGFFTQPSALEARWSSQGAVCLHQPRLKGSTHPLALELFGTSVEVAIERHCPKQIPVCSDLDVNNFDGASRISGNP